MKVKFMFGRKYELEDVQQPQEEAVYVKAENGELKKIEDDKDEDC